LTPARGEDAWREYASTTRRPSATPRSVRTATPWFRSLRLGVLGARAAAPLHGGRALGLDPRRLRRSRRNPGLQPQRARSEPLEGENRGRQLKNIPEHLVRPGVSVSLPRDLHVEALGTILVGRFLDDGNRIPLDDAAVLDLRLAKGFGRWKARLDLLNVTNRNWEEIGLALPDGRGELVPYYFPAAGFTARAGVEWSIQ
jgi:hypothetical protein